MNNRKADFPVDKLFTDRWSPRSFTDEKITENELKILFEAARWAASSYNAQPWRFVYALSGTKDFDRFLQILVPFNQSWAKKAAALLFICSKKVLVGAQKEVQPNVTHALDAGFAWANFALQASLRNWSTHGMAGIDYNKAKLELKVPADFEVHAAVALGRIGPRSALVAELQAREEPSGRNPQSSFVYSGAFPDSAT